MDPVTFREDVRDGDRQNVRRIVAGTGFFHPPEVEVAVELVDESLTKGAGSGYLFLFADAGDRTIGFACYGPIACTAGSYDLYWIAVDRLVQGQGVGRQLIERTENRIAAAGGRRIYIETSGRDLYRGTRDFYERCGYEAEAILRDFYAPGDDKYVYVKSIR